MDYKAIFRPVTLDKFTVFDRLDRNVALLRLFPSISTDMIRSCLQSPIRGVVLQTYGAGNMPSNRDDIISILKEASQRGVIIINITQCMHGCVESLYETGEVSSLYSSYFILNVSESNELDCLIFYLRQ